MKRLVIVCGAGATLADSSLRSGVRRPPLDAGFFSAAHKLGLPEFAKVAEYFWREYKVRLTEPANDSLEAAMAVIYADVHSRGKSNTDVRAAFWQFLRLITHRIAESTNALRPSPRGKLYRILRRVLSGYNPTEITIITFNYDLHIERTLSRLQLTTNSPWLMSFPAMYRLDGVATSKAPKSAKCFSADTLPDHVTLLKLHGSLNWYTTTQSNVFEMPSIDATMRITRRRLIDTSMKLSEGDGKVPTMPIIVPPVVNKAAILHEKIRPIWKLAEESIREAREIIFYGYSLPTSDQESINMFRRALKNQKWLHPLTVIDPSEKTLCRIAEVSKAASLRYFRSSAEFLREVSYG